MNTKHKLVKLTKVTIDTTMQEKNIACPTDAKLLNKARANLVKIAKQHTIKLRQNDNQNARIR